MATIPNITEQQFNRLTLWTERRLRRLYWRGMRPDPAEFLAEAIEKVLEGKRPWDSQRVPDFEVFIKGVIRSRVSACVRSWHQRVMRPLLPRSEDEDGNAAYQVADDQPDPAQICEDKEFAALVRSKVVKALDGDELAERIFECIEAGITNRSEIAEYLEVPVSDIDNSQKRMWRRIDKVLVSTVKGTNYEQPKPVR